MDVSREICLYIRCAIHTHTICTYIRIYVDSNVIRERMLLILRDAFYNYIPIEKLLFEILIVK